MTMIDATAIDDDLDVELGEKYYGDTKERERAATDDLVGMIHRTIEERFERGRGEAHRDAHAGDNGCVRAIFRVDADLDPKLRHGAFEPGREYPAWIRFSNGNSNPGSSRLPDARGMAIKLMGVPGDKLMPDEAHTQDFILISSPAFFVDHPGRYKCTLKAFLNEKLLKQWSAIFCLRPREALLALRANVKWIVNPLFHQYWSMTPYRLGAFNAADKTAVKYTAKPRLRPKRLLRDYVCDPWRRLVTFFSPGFSLKNEMNNTLASHEMWFDFYVQRSANSNGTPIEDTTVEWKERDAPLCHVAKIIIPIQDIMSAERAVFCEDLSFSPWHSLPEHRPLGLTNRIRRKAYLEISTLRHRLNRRPAKEPTGDEPI
jgi:hypothetical protein